MTRNIPYLFILLISIAIGTSCKKKKECNEDLITLWPIQKSILEPTYDSVITFQSNLDQSMVNFRLGRNELSIQQDDNYSLALSEDEICDWTLEVVHHMVKNDTIHLILESEVNAYQAKFLKYVSKGKKVFPTQGLGHREIAEKIPINGRLYNNVIMQTFDDDQELKTLYYDYEFGFVKYELKTGEIFERVLP